jgi:para-nitrobenzyl esterase
MTSFETSRRAVVAGAAALGIAGPAYAQAAPIAATKAGQVRGTRVDGIYAFKGVRYGATTEGRRFMPPLPPTPWTGVQDATDFRNHAPQLGADRPKVYDSWANPRPESEDCLFLNVYTPGLRDGRRRPVMVWFHGGGYTSGSPSSHYADGTRLAKRGDVVVVTVTHRLNAFGYLYLAHLDPALADSGNVGNLDMIAALRWVRDNIAEFGGDPGNVLIFGQSGGGSKVSSLMVMPGAAGLFHRAVVQSGSAIRSTTVDAAQASTARVMRALNLPVSAEGVARLKAMPRTQLSAGIVDAGGSYGTVVDGRSVPRHPFDPDAPAVSRSVPMLIGSTTDETASLIGGRDESLFSLTWDTLPARLSQNLQGMDVNRVIAELRRVYPNDKPSDIFFTATTNRQFRRNSILQAERKAAQGGAPAYMYLFAWRTPVDGGKWKSPHSVEHAFVFDNVAKSASMVGAGAEQQRVADAVANAWIRFARSGNPGWAPYTPARRTTMVFDAVSRTVDDPRREERVLFAQA